MVKLGLTCKLSFWKYQLISAISSIVYHGVDKRTMNKSQVCTYNSERIV